MANTVTIEDAKVFLDNQCWMLSSAIMIANDITDSKYKVTKISDEESLQLAEQFAHASGILMACVIAAEEQNSPSSTIKMYESSQKVFTNYAYQAGLMSSGFATEDELVNHLGGLMEMTVDDLHHYRIAPMELHASAMQNVVDSER